MKTPFLAITAMMAFVPITKAAVVNIKFGTNAYTGAGVVGDDSYWNHFSGTSGSTLSTLLDSQGNNTTLSIQVTYGSGFFSSNVQGATPEKLLGSGLYGPFSFAISGLESNGLYTVYTFHHDKAGESTTTQLMGSSSESATPTSTIVSTSFDKGGNYLEFGDFSPTSGGVISGASSIAWGGLNGIQIAQVPEPRATLLVLFVTMGLLRRCKKG